MSFKGVGNTSNTRNNEDEERRQASTTGSLKAGKGAVGGTTTAQRATAANSGTTTTKPSPFVRFSGDSTTANIQFGAMPMSTGTVSFTRSQRNRGVAYDRQNPTFTSVLGQIYRVSGDDYETLGKHIQNFLLEADNPDSPIWNPYLRATATNPKYQESNEAATLKAEQQMAEAADLLTYWAKRKDLNLSAEEIIARVNLDSFSEIKKMNKTFSSGEYEYYTRPMYYSPDWAYGIIWAAWNEGGTGNPLVDLASYAQGIGHTYLRNDDLRALYDFESGRYNPYKGSAQLEDAQLYFRVAEFAPDWTEKNRYLMNGSEDDRKYWKKVNSAEQTTREIEMQTEELYNRLPYLLETYDDPAVILEKLYEAQDGLDQIEGRYGGRLDMLEKIDEGLPNGTLLATTRPLEYSRYELEQYIADELEKKAQQSKASQYAQSVITSMHGTNTISATDEAINAERDVILNNAKETVYAVGSDIEVTTFSTYAAAFDQYVQEMVQACKEGSYAPEDLYGQLLSNADRYAMDQYLEALSNADAAADNESLSPADRAAILRPIIEGYTFAAEVAAATGVKATDVSGTMQMLDWIYANGKTYEAPDYQLYTAFDIAREAGATTEQLMQAAEYSTKQAKEQIAEIDAALAFIDENKVRGAKEYRRNLESRRSQLERDVRDAEYFTLQQTAKDFDEVVAAYKEEAIAAQKEYDKWFLARNPRTGYKDVPEFDANIASLFDEKGNVRPEYMGGDMRQYMTQKEADTYLYISATKGHEAAREYFDYLQETLYLRFSNFAEQQNIELVQESPVHAAIASAASVALSPFQAVGALYGVVQTIRGEEINPYSPAFAVNNFIGTTRETVEGEIAQAIEDPTWKKIAMFGYDVATSSADSIAAAVTGAGLGVMAAEAASNSLLNAKLSGATNAQALGYAGCTAMAETITEVLPLDELVKAFKGGKNAGLNILKSVATEGVGEMASEVLQNTSERQILGALSGYEAEVAALVESGMDPDEAANQVFKAQLRDLLYTGLVGGASGAASTGTAFLAGKVVGNNRGNSAQNTNAAPQNLEQATQQEKMTNEQADGTEESSEQSREIFTQPEDIISAQPETNYKEYDVASYKLMAMFTNAMQTGDRASQAETLTAAFETAGVPNGQARASAQVMIARFKDDAAKALNHIVMEADRAGMPMNETMAAVTTLTLADFKAIQPVVKDSASITVETVQNLVEKAKAALTDPKVADKINKAIYDSEVANAEAELIADGALAGLESFEAAFKDAKRNSRNAEAMVKQAVNELIAAGEAVAVSAEAFNENPGDQKLSQQHQRALHDVESAAIVRQQQEQHLSNMKEQLAQAKQMLDSKRAGMLKEIRVKAKQIVDQRRAEAAEAKANDRAAVEMAAAQMAVEQAAPAAENAAVMPAEPAAVVENAATTPVAESAVVAEQAQPAMSAEQTQLAAQNAAAKTKTSKTGNSIQNPTQTARNLFHALDTKVALGTRKMDRGLRGEIPTQLLSYYENHANYAAVREGSSADFNQTMFIAGNVIQNKIGMEATPQMVEALPKEFGDMFTQEELPDAAVAEFVRMYMMEPSHAVTFAGSGFVNRFEKAIRKAGIAKAVHAARDNVQAYIQADVYDRVKANIVDAVDANRKPSLGERMRQWVTKTFDWTNPLYAVDTKVKEGTGTYGNVQTAAKRRNVSRDIAANLITNGLATPDGRIVDESLSTVLEPISAENADEFFQYVLTKHSIDRDTQEKPVFEKGITTDDRMEDINRLEGMHPEYVSTLKRFNGWWQRFINDWMVGTGLLTEDAAQLLFSMYPNYVPTTRDVDGAKSRFDFGAKGSEKPVINPMDSIADRMNEIVDASLKNLAATSFHNAFQNAPGLGLFAREITSDMERIEIDLQDKQKKVKEILQENNVDNDVIADILNTIGSNAVMYTDTGTSAEGDVLRVNLPGGNVAYYQFSDPLVYEALTGNGKARPKEMNGLLKFVSGFTSFMSRMATTFAPTFAASNPIKDIQSSVNYGSWASNYVSAIPKLISSAISVARNDATYQEYKALGGGERKSIQVHDVKGASQYRNMLIKNYYKVEKHGRIKHAGKVAMDVLSASKLNEVLENMTRLAEYKYGKHDRTTAEGRIEAFQAAQDATTDFGSGGSGNALIALRATVPFLNPNLQGTYRAGREFTGRERGRAKVRFAKRAFNTAMACAIAAILRAKLSDEEDRYADISDEIKNTHLIIPNVLNPHSDRRFIRIPISQDPFDQFIHSLITSGIEEFDGTDDFITELLAGASAIVDNITFGVSGAFENLLAGEGDKAVNSLLSGTVIGPAVGALALNLNYYNSPIVSDYMSETPSLQYDETTPEIFIKAAEHAPFGWQLSPKMLEYLYNQYTGYGGQMLTGLLSGENPISALTEAFHKRFTIDAAYTNDISSAYSQNKAFLDNLTNAVEDHGVDAGYLRADLTDAERTAAYEEALELKNGLRKETNDAISALYDELDAVKANETLTDEQRNMLILDYRDQIAEQQVNFNEVMGEFYAKYVTGEDPLIQMIAGHQNVTPLTDFEKLDNIFLTAYDNGEKYMQRSYEVWEAMAGEKDQDNMIPHPAASFEANKVKYDVASDEKHWAGYVEAYNKAYKSYLTGISAWDDPAYTLEMKRTALKNAHAEARDKAKDWYLGQLALEAGR